MTAVSAAVEPQRPPSFLMSLLRTDCDEFMLGQGVRRFLARERPPFDIIHIHQSQWLAGFGVEVGRRLGIPVVVKEASYPVLAPVPVNTRVRWKYEALRRNAYYMALTREAATQLVEKGVDPECVFTVPNGVELPTVAERAADTAIVLCVANLWQGDECKGFSTLLAAWRDVHARNPSAVLAIVGDGDSSRWRDLSRSLGVEDSVTFPGACRNMADWYRRTSVFALASRVEGMSNALLEAQSWGLPAVVSDIPGNRAVVQDGLNGIVFPVGDSARLAEGLIRLLDSREQRDAMGRAGRRKIESEFAVSVVVERLVQVYRRAIENGVPRLAT